MDTRTSIPVLTLTLALLGCGMASAAPKSSRTAFRWSGPAGGTLRIRDLNGAVVVERAPAGAAVSVIAEVRWRRSNPAAIHIVRRQGAGGTTICALWPAAHQQCDADGTYRHSQVADNDLEVRFRILVPDGTPLDLVTTNGAIRVAAPSPSLTARTENGAIDARVTGRGRLRTGNGSVSVTGSSSDLAASSTNGSIKLALDRAPARGSMRLETTNGSIKVTAPAGLDADVDARTVNGVLEVGGRRFRGQVRTRLGRGGLALEAHTVNGAVHIAGK